MRNLAIFAVSALLLASFVAFGCSFGKQDNPIASYEPEVYNETDNFQFQVTGADKIDAVVEYQWNNTGTQASVDHSTETVEGSATLILFDANHNQVYTSDLLASSTSESSPGTAGAWTVRIVFNDFSGTANFRAEKLTPIDQ